MNCQSFSAASRMHSNAGSLVLVRHLGLEATGTACSGNRRARAPADGSCTSAHSHVVWLGLSGFRMRGWLQDLCRPYVRRHSRLRVSFGGSRPEEAECSRPAGDVALWRWVKDWSSLGRRGRRGPLPHGSLQAAIGPLSETSCSERGTLRMQRKRRMCVRALRCDDVGRGHCHSALAARPGGDESAALS